MKYSFLIVICIFLSIFQSCLLIHKQRYFVNNTDSISKDTINTSTISTYKIRAADVLSIKIISLDPNITAFFNVDDPSSNSQATPGTLYMKGYIVNDSGCVNIPSLGFVHVEGFNLQEVQKKVQALVDENFKNATVIVKLISYKVTVLGEVTKPGYYYFYNEKVTVLEALANAGDMTLYGNRSKIRLIREEEGVNKIHFLNINDANIIHSEFFYLMPNDVIYVEPTRSLVAKFNITNLTLAFSAISLSLLILNYLSK